MRHAVLRPGRPRETALFAGDEDADTRHWGALLDDRIVGVVSVMAAPAPDGIDADWQLRGMAVLSELQGAHVGAALVRTVHAEVAAPMWCNARAAVEGFYARQGWRAVGELFEIPPIGPHRRMWWPGA
ncbi:MAG: GNAT family N-acetyltransferase [Alphaproteobacteria bacterium]|nr:GNAT family N-acetyltransferase [Alphaproteobacteria bacterium]MCB9696303.1 GNAT family N-acetyltransferase [Alphaproteobacteria bacterium]